MRSKRINLLFIVNSLQVGGAERHVVTLFNHLDSASFRCSLAYLKGQDALLNEIEAGPSSGRVFCCDVAKKIDRRSIGMLADVIREENIDVVVCINSYSLLYGWLARIRSGRQPRIVQIFHTTDPGSMAARLKMAIYRPLFLACDVLVYVCEQQRKYWRSAALRARRDTVIYNGIDLHHFSDRYTNEEKRGVRERFGLSAEHYVIGLCAAMRPEKAHGDLLRALALLRPEWPDAKILFIGDGPERARIEEQIRTLRLDDSVRITGLVGDVRPAIAACDAMVLVSHHVETFSIAALEAMALEKPMVMSRIGGAEEQIADGENGYLYQRRDIGALAAALRKLRDRDHCRHMGTQARRTVEQRFSLPAMMRSYNRLFAELGGAAPKTGSGHAG